MNEQHNAEQSTPRRVILLGSTGSIGVSTLSVLDSLDQQFELVGMAAGRNAEVLIEQAVKFKTQHLAIADSNAAATVQTALPDAIIYHGPDAALQLIEALEADVVVAAIVGSAGLPATCRAIEKGMDIALANKETLIAAGELVIPLVEKHGVHLLPVDSEHSAIFQCLQTINGVADCQHIKRITLTASGGPFREWPKDKIMNATVSEALNHPTWSMGRKITIDSASMMNKALEIIEAHWLFGLHSDEIGVIVHPQSIAHSFVEFVDSSILAQLGEPDMRTPIQYALTWPERVPGPSRVFDWSTMGDLIFEQPDFERFPALKLAYRVVDTGGLSGAILNAANEAAVAAFLDERIKFGQIAQLVEATLDAIPADPVISLDQIMETDQAARAFVEEQLLALT